MGVQAFDDTETKILVKQGRKTNFRFGVICDSAFSTTHDTSISRAFQLTGIAIPFYKNEYIRRLGSLLAPAKVGLDGSTEKTRPEIL